MTLNLPKRAIVVVMCFLAMLICFLDRVSMSTAVLPMAEAYNWSATTKGWVLSSFFIGYLFAQIPGGWLVNRYGGRAVLGVSLIWWSVATILTPIAAMASLGALITVRIAMGLGEAAVTPALYNLAARWLPEQERSRSLTIMIGGIPAGTVVGLSLSGWMISAHPWPWMFYAFGAIGIVFAFFWYRLIFDGPATHPTISREERELLRAGQTLSDLETRGPVPWKRILTKRPVWALIFNHFCSNWSIYVLITWLPSYFSAFKGLGLTGVGLSSALPWLILFLVSNLAAFAADRLVKKGVKLGTVRKAMQALGLLGSASCLLVAAASTTPLVGLVSLCGAVGMLGCTWSGFAPNHLEIGPRYADILSGLTNTAGTLPGIIGVAVTGVIVDMTGGFSAAFQLAAIINVLGTLVWLFWSTSDRIID